MNHIPSANRGSLRAKAYDNPVVDRKEKDMKIIVDEMPLWPHDCIFCTPNDVCLLCNIIYGTNYYTCDLIGSKTRECPYLTTQSTATTK